MKIVTILGTRPEIIRLSRIIPKLDQVSDHVLVHTGQNNAATLSDIFFSDLKLRAADHYLGVNEPDFARQIGRIMAACYDLLLHLRPDRLLILGDTNSALSGVVAKRLGIPVFHMEAGNRCFDERVPEEVNRRIVDHASDILLPYTERSRQNLLREGFPSNRIFVTGNPIYEVIAAHEKDIAASKALDAFQVTPGNYFLATLHRAENVDDPQRLSAFVEAFRTLGNDYGMKVLVSTHPRTRARLLSANLGDDAWVTFTDPRGFFDFVALEKQARCVLSDSGTVQEECAILKVPSVTLRDVTERPETIECGANILTGCDVASILSTVAIAMENTGRWLPPPEYLAPAVSDAVLRIIVGYVHGLSSRAIPGID
jgi:UDP-N-acetylglucosamine 2-epimerase (non-hydrolysing)